MAYVVPTTLSTGCLVSAASWNQNTVNNILAIVASPLTIDFVNDRVGINNSLPVYAMEVKANTGGNVAARFEGALATMNTVRLHLYGASSATDLFAIGTDINQTGQRQFAIYDIPNAAFRYHISASGAHVINSSTCNTFNTQGLTIQQGAADDEALSLKSTDVAHGMTSTTETDTYGLIQKYDQATKGGMGLRGFSGSTIGLSLIGFCTTQNAVKSIAAEATVSIVGNQKSGTGNAPLTACANILVVKNSTDAKFIFRMDGDLYADAAITASAYDSHDDVSLVRALELERQPGSVVRDVFDSWIKYNRRDLEAADIATFNDGPGGDGSVFVNVTGLQRLHSGAIWQMHKVQKSLEDRIAQLERLLLGPPGPTGRAPA